MNTPKLFIVLLGCRPPGRLTEQHDVFAGIGSSLSDLVPHMQASWPEGKNNLHVDAWREVTAVEGYTITVCNKTEAGSTEKDPSLFFINLGGYKPLEFEEFHYKLLLIAGSPELAKQKAKQHLFYKQTGFKGASAHVDEQYGLDVDDLYDIKELLLPVFKDAYSLRLSPVEKEADTLHLGYLPLWKIKA